MQIGTKIWILDEPNHEYQIAKLYNEDKYFTALAKSYSAPTFKLAASERDVEWFDNQEDMLLARIARAEADLKLEMKRYEKYFPKPKQDGEYFLYFMLVSGLWQETTEQAYSVMSLPKFKIWIHKYRSFREVVLARLEQVRGYAIPISDIEDLLDVDVENND